MSVIDVFFSLLLNIIFFAPFNVLLFCYCFLAHIRIVYLCRKIAVGPSVRAVRPFSKQSSINLSSFFLLSIFSIENNWTNGQFQLNHKDTQISCIVCRMNVNWISSKNDRATAYPCRTKIRMAGCECEGRFWKSLDRRKNIQKQHWFGIFYRQWPSKTHAVCACVICIWTAEDVEIVLRYSVNPEQPRK